MHIFVVARYEHEKFFEKKHPVPQLACSQGGTIYSQKKNSILSQDKTILTHTRDRSLEAQKAEVIAQANAQKALLAKEVKHLRSELDSASTRGAAPAKPVAANEDQVRVICVCMHVCVCVFHECMCVCVFICVVCMFLLLHVRI
jgi:hypothetical protein